MKEEGLVHLEDLFGKGRNNEQSEFTFESEREERSTRLRPSLSNRVPVPISDSEENDSGELSLEVETESNRETRNGERLTFDFDDGVVERGLGGISVVQETGGCEKTCVIS